MPGFRNFMTAEKPERPADPAVRKANLRRVSRLFRPYRLKLSVVLGLIVFSAALGVVSPFLLRAILDTAIPDKNTKLLSLLAGGMIVIAIVTGVLGVVQTLFSNQVGQSVMHDLRSAVYRHLQRLSLAFFTRTRTGEVQSRISNDIGGVQEVVTSTATSIISNVTTVDRDRDRDVAARLAARAVRARAGPGLRPAHAPGRPAAPRDRQVDAGVARRHLEPRAGVALGLGDPAREDDGPQQRAAPTGSRASRGASPGSRCSSGWRAAG